MRLIKVMGVVLLCLAASGCEKVRELVVAGAHQEELKSAIAQARTLHDEGQSLKAIELFKRVVADPVASDTQKTEALRFISLGYYELTDFERSGKYAARAAAHYPQGSYDYLVNMADADLRRGQIPSASVRLEQAVKLAPRELPANNVLGLLYLGDNGAEYADYTKALVFNQAAYDIAPGRITEIVLVRNLIKLKQYETAELHLTHLRQQYPEDGRVRTLKSEVDHGRELEAAVLQTGITRNP